MQTSKMRIAVIGNGKGANRYHIPFIIKTGKMDIKYIYARHIKHDWPIIEGTIYTDNINDILNDPEIELVVISTPFSSHYPLSKQCLEAGKNVVCDKAMVDTPEHAKELFDLAKEKGVMMQCYQNRRFDSDFLTGQKVIESGKLGKVYEVEMHYDYYRPYTPESVDHFDPYESFIYGHACHTLDQAISYFGIPKDVRYDSRQILGEGRMNDSFQFDLYYDNELKVTVASSFFRIKTRPKFIAYGTRGMFVKQTEDRQEEHLKLFYMPDHEDFGLDRPQDYGVITYEDAEGVYHEEAVPTVFGGYEKYYDAVYETIRNGAEQLVKPEETIAQIKMLHEAIQQCK